MTLLQNINIGKYLPIDSSIHRLDPRVKIIILIGFMIWILSGDIFLDYFTPTIFLFAAILLAKLPFKYILKNILALKYLFIVSWILNIVFTEGDTLWQCGIINITREGLYQGTLVTVRLVYLILGSSLLTLTTSPIQLTDALEKMFSPLKKINFPAHEIALMVTISFRFIPILFQEIDKIMKAQMCRGVDFSNGKFKEKIEQLISIFMPLFMSSFRRAEELALSMEARGYRGGENRTHFRELNMTIQDYGTLIFFIIIFFANWWFFKFNQSFIYSIIHV